MTLESKILKEKYPKEYKKYFKAMSYQMFYSEILAMYNVLVLEKRSKDKYMYRLEEKVIEILNR